MTRLSGISFEIGTPWFGFYVSMIIPCWMFALYFNRDNDRGRGSVFWRFAILSGNFWIGLPEKTNKGVSK